MTAAVLPAARAATDAETRMLPTPVAAVAGIAFVVLGTVPFLAAGSPPDPGDAPAKFLAYYQDHRAAIITADVLGWVATACALIVFGKLLSVLRRLEGRTGTLTIAALLQIGATVAGVTAALGISAATAFRVDAAQHLGAETVVALNDAVNLLNVLSSLPFAVFLALNAVAILRTRALPRWLGGLAALASAVAAVGVLGVLSSSGSLSPGGAGSNVVSLLPLVYILAASVLMLVRPAAFDD